VASATNLAELQAETQAESAPLLSEVLMVVCVGAILFVLTVAHFREYSALVRDFGDSQGYMSVAAAIRTWNFQGLQIKQFWGYPYAMAALSSVTRLPEISSLLLISSLCSLVAVALAFRLWGPWVAGVFAVLNFDWLQRAYLGGSEPLFVALLFACFLAARKDQFTIAALFASLSTVVRPLGVFSLVGISVLLLHRRDFRRLAVVVCIGATVAILYMLPFARHFNDPLATVHSYQGPHRPLFGIPFYAIIEGTLLNPPPITNLLLSFGWIFFVLAGAVAAFSDEEFKAYARRNPVEILFTAPYLLLIVCYNYPAFARGTFARFAIPIIPFVLLALKRWLPQDRRLLWALGLISPVLAAASALGIKNLVH
jgi:hypothetical protein